MPYTAKQIEEEYNLSASNPIEYQKVKWGSTNKMLNRFNLAISLLPFEHSSSWLDIGSGTGNFQELVVNLYPHLEITGIDIASKLVEYSKSKLPNKKVHFECKNFMEIDAGNFDLITCIGVLQKTCFSVGSFFEKCSSIVHKSSQIFVDTKNRNWVKFKEPDITPEQSHEWFEADEIISDANKHNFSLLKAGGLDTDSGQITEINSSHNMFLIFERK